MKPQNASEKTAKIKKDFVHFDTKLCKSYAKYANPCQDEGGNCVYFFFL